MHSSTEDKLSEFVITPKSKSFKKNILDVVSYIYYIGIIITAAASIWYGASFEVGKKGDNFHFKIGVKSLKELINKK